MSQTFPSSIQSVDQLDELLSEPTAGLLADLKQLPGDFMVLGVGGKMGPTLARMIRRGLDQLGRRDKVIGVARCSTRDLPQELEKHGVQTVPCDLLDRNSLAKLPEAPNIIFMAGQKFGTATGPELTWAMNTLVPANVAERFPKSKIVVFSTGCVYPLSPTTGTGSREEDPLGPPGDYANSCVGRERIFTHFSKKNGTPIAVFRLNYAVELRYGVLVDLAQKIWHDQEIDVAMGHVNLIWQRDANAQAIQCLAHAASPPFILNVTGAEKLLVRDLAIRLGKLMGKPAKIVGQEAPTAWLSDAGKSVKLFGHPTVSIDQTLVWVADWVKRGGATLNKPTHFEVRDGTF
jgi:nucleoside-diphosphate-sugar epimerase